MCHVFATEGPDPREMNKSHLLFSIRILPWFQPGLEIALLITTLKEFLSCINIASLTSAAHFFYHFAYLMLKFSLAL